MISKRRSPSRRRGSTESARTRRRPWLKICVWASFVACFLVALYLAYPGASSRRVATTDAPASVHPAGVERADRAQADGELTNVPDLHDKPVQATPDELVTEAFNLAGQLTTSLPNSDEAWCSAGRIYYTFNEASKAHKCWETALRLNPDSGDTLFALGQAAQEQGDYENTEKYLRKSMEKNRATGRRTIVLADALMNLDRAPEAAAVLEEFASRSPLPSQGLLLLGKARMECGKVREAAECYAKVLAAEPGSTRAHFGLSRCYEKLGETDKAQDHREQIRRLRERENAQHWEKRPEEIKKDYSSIFHIRELVEFHTIAGTIFAKHGQIDVAERQWLRAVALDPPNPEPRAWLAELYRRQGRPIDAARVLGQGGAVSPSLSTPR